MDDNRWISHPLLSNQSGRKIVIFKSDLTKKEFIDAIAWDGDIETISKLFMEDPYIPQHYDTYIR